MFVYTEAEMDILHIIQLILLFPFVCEAVGEVEWKRGPELPHLTLYISQVDYVFGGMRIMVSLMHGWFETDSSRILIM